MLEDVLVTECEKLCELEQGNFRFLLCFQYELSNLPTAISLPQILVQELWGDQSHKRSSVTQLFGSHKGCPARCSDLPKAKLAKPAREAEDII